MYPTYTMEFDNTPRVDPYYATPDQLAGALSAYANQRTGGVWGRDSITEVVSHVHFSEEINADTAEDFTHPEDLWEITERQLERQLTGNTIPIELPIHDRSCCITTEVAFHGNKKADEDTLESSQDTPREPTVSYTLEYDIAQKLSYHDLSSATISTITEEALVNQNHVLYERIDDEEDVDDVSPKHLRKALSRAKIERFSTANYAISALGQIAICEVASGYRIDEEDVIVDSYPWVNRDILNDPTDHHLSPEEELMNQLMDPGETEHIRRALGILSILSGISYAEAPPVGEA